MITSRRRLDLYQPSLIELEFDWSRREFRRHGRQIGDGLLDPSHILMQRHNFALCYVRRGHIVSGGSDYPDILRQDGELPRDPVVNCIDLAVESDDGILNYLKNPQHCFIGHWNLSPSDGEDIT